MRFQRFQWDVCFCFFFVAGSAAFELLRVLICIVYAKYRNSLFFLIFKIV